MEIPVQHVAGAPLNDEQRKYLEGYFAGLTAHGVKFADVEPAPAAQNKVSLDDQIFEERVKHELHPLDAYGQILENAPPTNRRKRRTFSVSNGTAFFS